MTTESPIRPQNILELSTKEKRKFLDSIDYVFSDIDGVVWNIDTNFEDAAAGFTELQNLGKKVTFVTNNSFRTADIAAKKLKALGVNVEENDIMHPARGVVEYLKSINFDGLIYIIATDSFKNFLKDSGFNLIDGPTDSIKESWYDLISNVVDREPVKAVVIDYDFNITTTKLTRAHLYLRDPNCKLVIGATDTSICLRKDLNILGPGQFSRILVESSNNNVATLGKPGKELAEVLLKLYGIKDPLRALMIGDMLEQDIAFGRECGFRTLAVLSGGCSLEDILAQVDTKFIPDYYAENVGDFVKLISEIKNSKT